MICVIMLSQSWQKREVNISACNVISHHVFVLISYRSSPYFVIDWFPFWIWSLCARRVHCETSELNLLLNWNGPKLSNLQCQITLCEARLIHCYTFFFLILKKYQNVSYVLIWYYQEEANALDFETQNEMPDQAVTAGGPVPWLVDCLWILSWLVSVFFCSRVVFYVAVMWTTPWSSLLSNNRHLQKKLS